MRIDEVHADDFVRATCPEERLWEPMHHKLHRLTTQCDACHKRAGEREVDRVREEVE